MDRMVPGMGARNSLAAPGAFSTRAPAGRAAGGGGAGADGATAGAGDGLAGRRRGVGRAVSVTGSSTSTWIVYPSTMAVTGRRVRSPTSTVYHLSSILTFTISGMALFSLVYEGYEDAGDYG